MTFEKSTITARAPARSCDAHFHVFGPPKRYQYGTDLRYRPPDAPLDDYLDLAGKLGIERYVFVQPSAYGRDNRCMVDAMVEIRNRFGPVCRGIVDVDEQIADAELAQLHEIGVRGVRINVSPIHPQQPGLADALKPRIARLEERCRELGWHLDFLIPGWLSGELMPLLRALTVDFSLAHLGMLTAREGVHSPGFQNLLALMKSGDGKCWAKLTGFYRISTESEFADIEPMVHAVIEAAPDRILWGSDYPHLSFAERVTSIELFNAFTAWVPESRLRRAILVDNPSVLFGFPR